MTGPGAALTAAAAASTVSEHFTFDATSNPEGNVLVDLSHLESSERTLWGFSFVLISSVGLFARYLDEVEQREAGRLLLRHTNMFCAAFTGSVAILYFSIIVLQAGNATLEGVLDVLVGKARLSPVLELNVRCVHNMMLAYMVQDLVGRAIWKNWKLPFVVHHIACIVGLVNCLWLGQTGMFGAAVGISEFSTPIVAVVEIARATRLTKLVVVAGILLNLVFPFRVVLFSYFSYLWAMEHSDSPFHPESDDRETLLRLSGLAAVVTLTLLNWTWWNALVQGTIQTLQAPNAPNPKSKAA